MERTLRVQEGLGRAVGSRVQENLAGIHVVKAYAPRSRDGGLRGAERRASRRRTCALARVRGFIGPVMNVVVERRHPRRALARGPPRRSRAGSPSATWSRSSRYLELLAWPTMALGWMLSVLQRGRAALARLNALFAVQPAIISPPGAHGAEAVPRRDRSSRRRPFAIRAAGGPAGARCRRPGRPRRPTRWRSSDAPAPGRPRWCSSCRGYSTSTAGSVLDRRSRRSLDVAGCAPPRRRRRAAGSVPVLDDDRRERRLRPRGNGDGDDSGWAVRVAGLARDLADMPHGLDTLVGERGITLSGGQKQRVTLARVLAVDPKVLILDDALSSVDSATERGFWSVRGFFRTAPPRGLAPGLDREGSRPDRGARRRPRRRGGTTRSLRRGGVYAEIFDQQMVEDQLEAL